MSSLNASFAAEASDAVVIRRRWWSEGPWVSARRHAAGALLVELVAIAVGAIQFAPALAAIALAPAAVALWLLVGAPLLPLRRLAVRREVVSTEAGLTIRAGGTCRFVGRSAIRTIGIATPRYRSPYLTLESTHPAGPPIAIGRDLGASLPELVAASARIARMLRPCDGSGAAPAPESDPGTQHPGPPPRFARRLPIATERLEPFERPAFAAFSIVAMLLTLGGRSGGWPAWSSMWAAIVLVHISVEIIGGDLRQIRIADGTVEFVHRFRVLRIPISAIQRIEIWRESQRFETLWEEKRYHRKYVVESGVIDVWVDGVLIEVRLNAFTRRSAADTLVEDLREAIGLAQAKAPAARQPEHDLAGEARWGHG